MANWELYNVSSCALSSWENYAEKCYLTFYDGWMANAEKCEVGNTIRTHTWHMSENSAKMKWILMQCQWNAKFLSENTWRFNFYTHYIEREINVVARKVYVYVCRWHRLSEYVCMYMCVCLCLTIDATKCFVFDDIQSRSVLKYFLHISLATQPPPPWSVYIYIYRSALISPHNTLRFGSKNEKLFSILLFTVLSFPLSISLSRSIPPSLPAVYVCLFVFVYVRLSLWPPFIQSLILHWLSQPALLTEHT